LATNRVVNPVMDLPLRTLTNCRHLDKLWELDLIVAAKEFLETIPPTQGFHSPIRHCIGSPMLNTSRKVFATMILDTMRAVVIILLAQ
jgi:hypothetical protein